MNKETNLIMILEEMECDFPILEAYWKASDSSWTLAIKLLKQKLLELEFRFTIGGDRFSKGKNVFFIQPCEVNFHTLDEHNFVDFSIRVSHYVNQSSDYLIFIYDGTSLEPTFKFDSFEAVHSTFVDLIKEYSK